MISASAAEAALRTVLPRYGIEDSAELDLVKYRENYVFRVTTTNGDAYAARVHRVGYHSNAELNSEANYLLELSHYGLQVPQLVATTDGAANCSHPTDETEVVIDLQHWIDDAAPMGDIVAALDGDPSLSEDDFHALGRELGRLHRACVSIGVPEDFTRGAWDTDGLAGSAPLWGDPTKLPTLESGEREMIASAMQRLHRRLQQLPRDATHFGVIHADLTPENVLISGADPTLIDFDDFGTGWHLFDLVTVLFFYSRHPLLNEYRRGLEAGYRSERPGLPADFFDPWEDLLVARGLTYLGWAAERHGDEEASFIEQRVVPVVLELIARQHTTPVANTGGRA
ncbi:phosphotransferase [Glutamicibacter endophyticus]